MTYEQCSTATILTEISDLMLPGNLEECLELHREDALRRACLGQTENRLSWLLHELNLFREDAPVTSFNDAFDPFLGLRHELARLPNGTMVSLPKLPSTMLAHEVDGSLVQLAEAESSRLAGRLDSYDDDEISTLWELAKAGFVDTSIEPDRDGVIAYISANASIRVHNHLGKLPDLVGRRTVLIDDMMADRRDRLRPFVSKYPSIFTSERDLECCTDAEIHAFTLELDSLLLSPKTRHLGICRRCKGRLLQWQAEQARFQQLATQDVDPGKRN